MNRRSTTPTIPAPAAAPIPALRSASISLALCLALVTPAARAGSEPSTGPGQQATGQPAAPPARQAAALLEAKDYQGAAKAYGALIEGAPADGASWYGLALARRGLGELDAAAKALDRMRKLKYATQGWARNAAGIYAGAGRKDDAFKVLGMLLLNGYTNAEALKADADLAPLRSDARFAKLVDRAEVNQHPCARTAPFEFWLGEWVVRDPQGNHLGDSKVTKILNGCVILEQWTDAQNSSGWSFNVIDPQTGRWRQTWVDDAGQLHEYTGEFHDGALVYLWSHRTPAGDPVETRMTFSRMPGGVVRQLMESSSDGGKEWATSFEGLYSPKEAHAAPK